MGAPVHRYAIYFVPPAHTPLWRYGCAALGYDSWSGEVTARHAHAFFSSPRIAEWTNDPGRYGFHATLKPPFALREGRTIEELEAAATTFANTRGTFVVERLAVRALGGFLALVPVTNCDELQRLAADCVTAFEPFRAPLTAADRAHRLKSPLTANQIAHLDRWGYPYVFDEFRFHMTLTGRLPEGPKAAALAALEDLYRSINQAVTFDAVTICEQPDRAARFRVRRRFAFGG